MTDLKALLGCWLLQLATVTKRRRREERRMKGRNRKWRPKGTPGGQAGGREREREPAGGATLFMVSKNMIMFARAILDL